MSTQSGLVVVRATVENSEYRRGMRDLGAATREWTDVVQNAHQRNERAAQAAARAWQQEAAAQQAAARTAAEISRRLQDQQNRATMDGVQYRIHAIRQEHEAVDREVRRMAISRREQERLIVQNAITMEARLTQVTQEEARRRAEAQARAAAAAGRSQRPGAMTQLGQDLLGGMMPGGALGAVGRAGVAGAAVAVSIGAITAAAKPAVKAASDLNEALQTLEIVSQRTGKSFHEAKGLVREFTDGITSSGSVAQAVRIFQTMNVSVDEQRRLISLLRDGITAMGGSVDEQLPLMALAIKRQESALLDNMGVTRTMEMMWKEYAATLGKAVDKLDQTERETAVLVGVMKDLGVYQGTAIAASDDYAGSLNKVASAKKHVAEQIGQFFLPALKESNLWFAENLKGFGDWLEKYREWRQGQLDMVAEMEKRKRGEAVPLGPAYGAEGDRRLKEAEGKAAAEKAAAQQKAREAAAKAAEEARKEAERQAKQAADEQKQLAAELAKDLELIGKTGHERERLETDQHYREMVAKAHGNAKLLVQAAEWRRRTLAEIAQQERQQGLQEGTETALRKNAIFKGGTSGEMNIIQAEITALEATGDKSEAASKRLAELRLRLMQLSEELKDKSRTQRLDEMAKALEGFNSRRQGRQQSQDVAQGAKMDFLMGQHDLDTVQGLTAAIADLEAAAKDANVPFKQRVEYQQRAIDLTQQLIGKEEQLFNQRAQAIINLGSQAGSFAANEMKGGQSAGDRLRGGSDIVAGGLGVVALGASGTIVGLPAAVALAGAAALVKVVGEIGGVIADNFDKDAAKRETVAEVRAASAHFGVNQGVDWDNISDKQLAAAKSSLEAARAFEAGADKLRKDQILEAWRIEDRRKQAGLDVQEYIGSADRDAALLAAVGDPKRTAELEAQFGREDRLKQAKDDFEGALVSVGQSALAWDNSDFDKEQIMRGLRKASEDGVLSNTERDELGIISGLNLAQLEKVLEAYAKAQANAVDPAQDEKKAIGSSKENPVYTHLVNAKDLMAGLTRTAGYRATGAGTRREGYQSGRGINVGRHL